MARVRGGRAIAVGLLVVAGCGGGGEGSSDEGPSPLAELMGWQPEEPAEQRRKELEREQKVAECMRAEGWEYEPVDWSAQMPDMPAEELDLINDPQAYGEKYGYGVVRNYELYEAEGIESGEGPGMGREFEDPNQDYVESLSQSEMEEYYATLQGDPDIWGDPDEDGMMVAPPLEEQGCYGQAQLAVYGEDPMSDPAVQERLNEFWEGQEDDPRLKAAHDEWRECMAEELDGVEVMGEPVTRPEQMYQVLDERKMAALGLEQREIDPDDPDAYEDVYMSYSEGEDGPEIGWFGTPEPISDADLEELREAEMAMWRIDNECQEEAGVREVQRRIEQELVDELVAEFPELAENRERDESSDDGS